MIYVCNVDEESAGTGNKYSKIVEQYALSKNMKAIKISANIESQIAQLDDDERSEYIDSLGLKEPGLNILIKDGTPQIKISDF